MQIDVVRSASLDVMPMADFGQYFDVVYWDINKGKLVSYFDMTVSQTNVTYLGSLIYLTSLNDSKVPSVGAGLQKVENIRFYNNAAKKDFTVPNIYKVVSTDNVWIDPWNY